MLDFKIKTALDANGMTYEVIPCDPLLADTAEFCAHYGIPPENACNTIIVVAKTEPKQYFACLVNATTKLDVNHKVSKLVGIKRLSFASSEETAELTDQMIGGVTLLALPATWPVYIDERIMSLDYAILGGGNRSSKIKLAPDELRKIPNTQVGDIGSPR